MKRKLAVISLAVLILSAGAVYSFRQSADQAVSVSAVVEGRLAAVSVSVPGTVKELYVSVGETVRRGQPLLALDPAGYERRLANERMRLAEIASQLPPDLLVTAPGSRPSSPGKPLETLRDEEDEARKKLEAAAHVHATANLALSRMSAGNPGEYTKTTPARQAALIARDEAAIGLQKAREAYEKASYARAQQEVRNKLEKSGGPVSAALAARIAEYEAQVSRVRLAEQGLAATILAAPEDGRVVLLAAKPGKQVAPGDAPAAIVPDDDRELWVMAFFTPENAARLAEGRECAVSSADGKEPFRGTVGPVMAAQDTEKHVAVRVILDQDALPAHLVVGQDVSVSVPVGGSGFVDKVLDLLRNGKN